MSKHTPGPWFIWQELAMKRVGMELDEITDELLWEGSFQIYAGNPIECTRGSLKGHSARICDIDADNTDFDNDDEELCKATALANARLIAAAPELLEALKGVLAWGTDENWENAKTWCEKARAAIAKAEGKS